MIGSPTGLESPFRVAPAAAVLALGLLASVAGAAPSRGADETAAQALARGLALDLGTRGAPDPQGALTQYTVAAKGGIAEAEFDLAVMYDSGVGTPIDRARAALWYGRAAAHGFPRAAYNLATLYASGDGVPADPTLAACWFGQAREGGIRAAAPRLRGPTLSEALRDAVDLDTIHPPNLSPVQVDPPVPGGGLPVEFTWTVPTVPRDAHFFVEIIQSLPDGGTRDVGWARADCSAALLTMPASPGRYAWRVFTTAPRAGHYAASEWTPFAVGKDGSPS